MLRIPSWLLIGGGAVLAYKAWRWWAPRPIADDATVDPSVSSAFQIASNAIGAACDLVGLNEAAGDQSSLPDPFGVADLADDSSDSSDSSATDDSGDDGDQFA
jgi:hypothetical protein